MSVTISYLNSKEYHHAAMLGLRTGIEYLFYSDLAKEQRNDTLAEDLKILANRSRKNVEAVAAPGFHRYLFSQLFTRTGHISTSSTLGLSEGLMLSK